jgi:DNA invertase Pin-like site-specific DNA recombinase
LNPKRRETRVAIYARVSKPESGQDPDNQVQALTEFAAEQGWTIAERYIDRETGATSNRPEYQRLFEDAGRRRFNTVLFWSLDRFSREGIRATLLALHRLTGAGVAVRSYTEPMIDTTTAIGELLTAFLATMARLERERISDRVKAGMSRARRAGAKIGRPKSVVDLSTLARLKRAGYTAKEIQRKTGISRATLFRRLREARP